MDAMERRWLDWAHTYLKVGDLEGAVDTLRRASLALSAYESG